MYDTNHMNYLSIVSKKTKWVHCKKDVFNIDSRTLEKLMSIQMDHIGKYSNGIRNVDLSDQPHYNYIVDY